MKRVYSRGTGEVTRSIRITKEMDEALAKLADDDGESINSYIGFALDIHLQTKADQGLVPWPKGFEPKNNHNGKKR